MNTKDFNKVTYPEHNVPDAEKEMPEFGLKMAEYIYGRHYQYGTQYTSWRDSWERNYLYMEGRQPVQQYQDMFLLNKGQGGEDESFLNVNWQILPILPKFMDLVTSMITKRTTKVTCNAINPIAESEKDKKIFAILADAEMAPLYEELAKAGIQAGPNSGEAEPPQTPEDLELYILSGGLKLAQEMAAELGIEMVMGDDKWMKIMPQLVADLFCTGRAVTREYLDSTGKLRVEAVRPQECLFDYTTKQDYSNVRWGGVFKFMTPTEFRAFASDELSDTEIDDLIHAYKGTTDLYYMHNGPNSRASWGGPDLDQYICVLDYWFYGTNNVTLEVQDTKFGGKKVRMKPDTWTPSEDTRSKKQKIQKQYEVVYQGFWVVGSQTVLKYGKMKNQGRNGSRYKAEPPMHVYIHQNRDGYPLPMAERVLPAADLIQVNWLKFQNLVAKEPPPGMQIDQNAVLNVANGKGGSYKFSDLLQIYTQTGNILTNPMDPETGERIQGYPIMPLNLNFAPAQAQALQNIQTNIDFIRQILGFNDLTDAQTPNPKTLVGVGELAVQSTNNAIYPLQNGLGLLKIMTAKSVICRLKALVKGQGYNGYIRDTIGVGARYLEVSEGIRDFDYEIELEELLNDEQRAEINRMVDIQLSVRQQGGGVGGIEIEDAFAIRRCKTLKQAELLMVSRKKKREAEDMQKQQANMQMQTESQMAVAQSTAQSKLQEAEMLAQFEIQKVATTESEKRKSMVLQHELRMKELALEVQAKTAVATITGEYKIEAEEMRIENRPEPRPVQKT